MFYKIPTNLYFEDECVINNASIFSRLGKTALIVGSPSCGRNGSLQDVKQALDSQGSTYYIYDTIGQNPTVEQVMEVVELYRSKQIDYVVGIGGGSPIDASKAIATMLYHEEKDAGYLYDKTADSKSLPVVAVPTTCGTGSEVTSASVLTRNDIKTKQSITSRIYPSYGLLDIKYLVDLPQEILVSTSVDAYAHLVESYISTKATDFSNIFAKEGMIYWGKCKDVLQGKSRSREDLYNLMMASVLGGMSIAHCGTSLPHGASYVLTYDLGIPHGKACAYFLASFMEQAQQEEVENVLSWSQFESLSQLKQFLEEICQFELLEKEMVDKCARVLLSSPNKLVNSPLDNSKETIYKVVSAYQKEG